MPGMARLSLYPQARGQSEDRSDLQEAGEGARGEWALSGRSGGQMSQGSLQGLPQESGVE